jgi:hypothetical protein
MKCEAFFITLGLLPLLASPASAANAEEERPWSVDVSASLVVLGDKRPTGGIAPTLAGRYQWELGELLRLQLGLSAAAFGFGDELRNAGFFVGPTASIGLDLKEWGLSGSAMLTADWGRAPVCNDWGLCVRYWGLWPKGTIAAAYAPIETFAVVGGLSARIVDTLGWGGVSWEPTAGGRLLW